MQREPTLNEMCEYIDSSRPKEYGFSIDRHRSGSKLQLWIKTPDPKKGFFLGFKNLISATEFLFNYYFAINNK